MSQDLYWLNKESRTFLSRDYLLPGITPEQRIRQIAETAQAILGIDGYADRFETYVRRGWFSLSSPIWSNFGAGRGLPISCNGSFIPDSMSGILEKAAEVGMMTKHGAGTSGFFGALRARGAGITNSGKSSGPIHFMELFDKLMDVVSQGNVRRGSFAAYLPVEHSDIEEFLQLREEGHAIQKLSLGITITDAWMKAMIEGDKDKRRVWGKIIKKRFESGYPYVVFIDTANRSAPQVYRDEGMAIVASNLCSEIMLPSSPDESFVCDLSSINLLHWDDLKDTDAVETLTYFLDAVMTDYIDKVRDIPFMGAAYRFAVNHRALGVGVLGWHSLLQSKMVPFESMEAKLLNTRIHRAIRDKTVAASREMAERYGEPPLLKGYGLRNTTTMAIAPTTSSSHILGQVSQGIEPLNSNYYVKDLAKSKSTYRNPYLQKVLEAHGKDNEATWKSILLKGGSVQHLTFLTDNERAVFKTFGEISQKEIVIQAAARQAFIDQGQSLNLMVPPKTPPREVSELMIEAWKLGVKALYYQRSANPAQELGRSILSCASCEA
jgi:ribonucleoside-diphosphate reductase alpha chain